MTKVNVHEAKTHFSRYLRRAMKGETIVLCLRNVPVAELRPIGGGGQERRPVGLDRGKLQVSEAFFDPLPDWLLEAFEGRSGDEPPPHGDE